MGWPAQASVRRLHAATSTVRISLQLRARHATTLSSTWWREKVALSIARMGRAPARKS
jgi:hypothetical protein